MFTTRLTTLLALAAAAVAMPTANAPSSALVARGFDCGNPVRGLAREDCQYLSQIGFAGYGQNPSSGNIWIGNNGPNVFTFSNKATVDVTLVIWDQSNGDASSFVTAHAPKITWTIPRGGSVQVSLQNGVSGGYSGIYRGQTKISQWGQVGNTWGEFTTGQDATINISREINMSGNIFSAKVSTGCLADMNHCAYVCKSGNTCGESGTYSLIGCKEQPNNNAGMRGSNPAGGCAGWSNGSGRIDAQFL
ncbi:hypothetical protein B0H66DRAFT_561738 [Apodospora peruviana]|uniref:Uncharacterized protein n=1 Tax=Apodospora peruviana TaxID=516989 RepID=A0AAE0I1A3_9PEZI|nr:hypothetical protein B0H66DRAFT_561738 [Apodospora peruviana]